LLLLLLLLFGSGVFLWKKCIPKNIRTQTDNTLTHTHKRIAEKSINHLLENFLIAFENRLSVKFRLNFLFKFVLVDLMS